MQDHRPGSVIIDVIWLAVCDAMKNPTPEQTDWASLSFQYTLQFYHESTRDGHSDFTPMIDLLQDIKQHSSFQFISVYKSLFHLTIASAAHVEKPFILNANAPRLLVAQLKNEFEFGTNRGKRRKCPYDDAANVLDNQLVMLSMLCAEFDGSNADTQDEIGS